MSDVPDDIRETAWVLLNAWRCVEDRCKFQSGCGCADDIAAALMAERERCAKIADEYDTGWTRFGPNIASAIRAPGAPT